MEGEIRRVILDKGFGFIRGSDGRERFFHRSALEPAVEFADLREGQRVTFRDEAGAKGPRAEDVRIL